MSSTQSTTRGFNQLPRAHSAKKSARFTRHSNYIDYRNSATAEKAAATNQNWVEAYDVRNNLVGYILKQKVRSSVAVLN